jgi:hypothetical protein
MEAPPTFQEHGQMPHLFVAAETGMTQNSQHSDTNPKGEIAGARSILRARNVISVFP